MMAEMETENEQLQEAVEGLQEQVDEYEADISQVRYAYASLRHARQSARQSDACSASTAPTGCPRVLPLVSKGPRVPIGAAADPATLTAPARHLRQPRTYLIGKGPRVSIGAAVDPAAVIAVAASMQAQGRQLLSSGSPLEAIPHLALTIQVLRRHPADCLDSWAQAYAQLGQALLAADRWSAARSNLEQSLALEPSAHVQELLTRADAAQRECQRACAAAVLQRAWRGHRAAGPGLRAALQARPAAPPPAKWYSKRAAAAPSPGSRYRRSIVLSGF